MRLSREGYVINMFGGRGAGKTTLTAGLFYHLKSLGFIVHMSLDIVPGMSESDKGMYLSYGVTPRVIQYEAVSPAVDYIITNNPLPMCLLAPGRPESFYRYVLDSFGQFRNINIFVQSPPDFARLNGEDEVRELLEKNSIPYACYERIDTGYGGIVALYETVRGCQEKRFGGESLFDPMKSLEIGNLKEYEMLYDAEEMRG